MTHQAHDKENSGWKTNYPTVSAVGLYYVRIKHKVGGGHFGR